MQITIRSSYEEEMNYEIDDGSFTFSAIFGILPLLGLVFVALLLFPRFRAFCAGILGLMFRDGGRSDDEDRRGGGLL